MDRQTDRFGSAHKQHLCRHNVFEGLKGSPPLGTFADIRLAGSDGLLAGLRPRFHPKDECLKIVGR